MIVSSNEKPVCYHFNMLEGCLQYGQGKFFAIGDTPVYIWMYLPVLKERALK